LKRFEGGEYQIRQCEEIIKHIGFEKIIRNFLGKEKISCHILILGNVIPTIGYQILDLIEKELKFPLTFKIISKGINCKKLFNYIIQKGKFDFFKNIDFQIIR
jgi:hypothetical protein